MGTFSIEAATLEFGARSVRPQSENRVMQSVFVSRALGGEIWYSQVADGTVSNRESTTVVRCTPSGAVLGEMKLADAGHGTGVFVERDNAGKIWVWSTFTDYANALGQGPNLYVRVPWVAGSTRSITQISSYVVSAISGGDYLTAHLDEATGIVGVRKRATSTSYLFEQHTLANIRSGVNNPTNQITFQYEAGLVIQGWALLEGSWYVLSGSSEEAAMYSKAQITRLNPLSGERDFVRDLEASRVSANGAVYAGFSEPEGLSVGRGSDGEPALVFGVSTGPTGGRSYTVWSLHMGASPFVSATQRGDYEWGDTGWNDTGVAEWLNGFSRETATVQSFQIRIAGGYLEMRGNINGAFAVGGNDVGMLREGYFHKTRQLRGHGVKGNVTGATSTTARIEINSVGKLSLWIASGDKAAGWVSLDGFRVPLTY